MGFWGEELEQEDREDHEQRTCPQQNPEIQDMGIHMKIDKDCETSRLSTTTYYQKAEMQPTGCLRDSAHRLRRGGGMVD